MSRNPGLGKSWYEVFKSDCFPGDVKVVGGRETLPPKYYGSMFEVDNPAAFARIKAARASKFTRFVNGESDNSFRRLRVREDVKMAQIKMLKRRMEI